MLVQINFMKRIKYNSKINFFFENTDIRDFKSEDILK